MPFSQEALDAMAREYEGLERRCNDLLLSYVCRNYQSDKAKEFAHHGFARRLQIMRQCIERVFELLPPENLELPSKQLLTDATINVQAFVFNTFGALDNLAWIWVSESGLTRPNGTPLAPSQVGIGPDNVLVRQSFSLEFQEYLDGLGRWFAHLEDFRHALAHRIPLYIPPYSVPQQHMLTYRDLEGRIHTLAMQGDWEGRDRLEQEQRALVTFEPWMKHSLYDDAPPVMFHPQLISDLKTLDELGQKLLEELGRLPA